MKNYKYNISDEDLIKSFAFLDANKSLLFEEEIQSDDEPKSDTEVDYHEVLHLLENPKEIATYHTTLLGGLEKAKESFDKLLAGQGLAKDWAITGVTIAALFTNPVQLYTDLELFWKNYKEAYANYETLVSTIPLERYGLETDDIYRPEKIKTILLQKIEENKDSPDDLYEIVKIIHLVSHLWIDAFSVVENFIFGVIDLLTIFTGPFAGPLSLLIKGILGNRWTIGFILSFVGGSIATSYANSSYWQEIKDKVKNICEEKISSTEMAEHTEPTEDKGFKLDEEKIRNLQRNLELFEI